MAKSKVTLDEVLATLEIERNLREVIKACALSTVDIATALRDGVSTDEVGSENNFGDKQLGVDLVSDACVFQRLRESRACAIAASEETPKEQDLGASADETIYSVGFDPLDGSSIVDCNFAVGSIFGIWEGRGLLRQTGRGIRAAIMSMYGPRVSMILAVKEVTMELQHIKGEWVVTRRKLEIAAEGKIFAPGNLRASQDHCGYESMVTAWLKEKYTLRYTGGMVPDVYHILLKEKGVFANVPSPSAKAKLRLLYECAPIAYIVETAKGTAVVATEKDATQAVLDVAIENMDQRVGVCYGGTKEIEKLQDHLSRQSA